jgi:hypothetical protein
MAIRWSLVLMIVMSQTCVAQLEVFPWGNLRGLRVQDELIPLATSVTVETAEGRVQRTAHYAQQASYRMAGGEREVISQMDGFTLVQKFRQTGPTSGSIDLMLRPEQAHEGVVKWSLVLELPVEAEEQVLVGGQPVDAAGMHPSTAADPSGAVTVKVGSTTYGFQAESFRTLVVDRGSNEQGGMVTLRYGLEFPEGMGAEGEATASFDFEVQDAGPLGELALHVQGDEVGREWLGLGGNFRLQFPETDPGVVAYNLQHLTLHWGRIAMWWNDWDPEESVAPETLVERGPLTERLQRQLELLQSLQQRGMRLIVSAWFPPAWATHDAPRPGGTYGEFLDPEKQERQIASIVAYLRMLKERLGVEVELFSFNEPDIGVRIIQDPVMHRDFMRALAGAIRAAGLLTRILAGDTSNGIPYSRSFAEVAAADPVLFPQVGALGFHTWGGCEPDNLRVWRELAASLERPLLISEGGADSEAHRNPDLFLDDRYQMAQAWLYLDLCRHAQVQSIMEWQMTADYSLLDGGGTYGREGPLEPTFRFWLNEHLGRVPAGWRHVEVTATGREFNAATFTAADGRATMVFLLNEGPERLLRIEGLAGDSQVWVPLIATLDGANVEGEPLHSMDGKLELRLQGRALTTLLRLP